MANRLQKQPVLTYVPAVSAIPARPAFCEMTLLLSGYIRRSGGGPFFVSAIGTDVNMDFGGGNVTPVYETRYDQDGQPVQQLIGWMVDMSRPSSRIPTYQEVEVCYPARAAIPGTPGRIDIHENNGWNGGARSVKQVPVGSYFQVSLHLTSYGVSVGLSDGAFDHSYGHASHALVARPSGITPVEYGRDVAAEQPVGAVVRLVRREDGVRMIVDDAVIYDSPVRAAGKVYGDVTLYSVADFVDDPIIGAYHETGGTAALSVVTAFAEDAGGVAEVALESLALVQLDGLTLTGGICSLQVKSEASAHAVYAVGATSIFNATAELTGFVYVDGDGLVSNGVNAYGYGALGAGGMGMMGVTATAKPMFGRGELPPARGLGRLNREEALPTQGFGAFPAGSGVGRLKVLRRMQGAGSAGCAGKGSERFVMGGVAPAATSYQGTNWWQYMPSWMMDAGRVVVAHDQIILQGGALFVVAESLQVGEFVDVFLVVNFEIEEFVGVHADVPLSYIVQMAIEERLRISGSAADARREALQYAVNAVTGALSEYRNFGFKQFARMGGETYAITDAGLYRLGAEGDDGQTINAMIDFGASDFGTARSKRISSVYAGIATDGEVYLRVTGDDGKEAIYKAVGDGVERRARTAKGVTARHWRLRLELVDAAYADLDNVEIEIGVSQRRLRSGR
ncbi:hypothetical protein SAMN05216256_101123 [Halopseudomonas pachastrellae]|nr:hypothetical protein SAMN05216256_101123 [Halopseudomonas pachastrellae]